MYNMKEVKFRFIHVISIFTGFPSNEDFGGAEPAWKNDEEERGEPPAPSHGQQVKVEEPDFKNLLELREKNISRISRLVSLTPPTRGH